MRPKLDRWITHGNVLVGYLYDHSHFRSGERVRTDAIVEFSPETLEARCVDGDYKLGEPGTREEHERAWIEKPKIILRGM